MRSEKVREWGSREAFPGKSSSIFVDNLPFQIRKIWVYNLFSRFGKIRNLFIPNKRSKISGQSFAFVRFSRVDDAEAAISKTNDSWYWNQKLVVKFPRFLKEEDVQDPHWCSSRNHSIKPDAWSHKSYYNQGAFLDHKSNQRRQNPQFQSCWGKEIQQQPKLHPKTLQQNHHIVTREKRGKEVWRRKGFEESSKQGEQKNGKLIEPRTDLHMGSIKVQAVGNGWLSRSAIAKMSRLVSTKDLEHVFRGVENIEVQIKAMGGRFVIITFSDSACRDSIIKEEWLSNWFEEIKPWKGEQAMEERFVWLACYGMPLNAWSYSTFQKIGEQWGQFLKIDEDTLKESSYVKARILIATNQIQTLEGNVDLIIEGAKFSVRVLEEDSFRFIMESLIDSPLELIMEKKKDSVEEGDDKAMHKDEVEYVADVGSKYGGHMGEKMADMEEKDGAQSDLGNDEMGNSNLNQKATGVPPNIKVVEDLVSTNSSLGTRISVMGKEVVLDSFGGFLMDNQSQNTIVDCLENQEDGHSDGRSIEKSTFPTVSRELECFDKDGKELQLAYQNPDGNDNVINEEELYQDHFEANHIPIQVAIKGIKKKSKRKSIDDILGYSKVDKGNTRGRSNKNKCVVLRSAIASAALSASISSGGINNRNRILLDEAKAIWEVDKIFGISYDGNEEEVISKIAEFEAQNKAGAVCPH